MWTQRMCASWLLVATVLVAFDPPQIFVYLDPQDPVDGVTETVARAACPSLRVDQVALPIPFEVLWLRKSGESQRYVPDPSRRVPGLLTTCP